MHGLLGVTTHKLGQSLLPVTAELAAVAMAIISGL
jgi:hypothetical protein